MSGAPRHSSRRRPRSKGPLWRLSTWSPARRSGRCSPPRSHRSREGRRPWGLRPVTLPCRRRSGPRGWQWRLRRHAPTLRCRGYRRPRSNGLFWRLSAWPPARCSSRCSPRSHRSRGCWRPQGLRPATLPCRHRPGPREWQCRLRRRLRRWWRHRPHRAGSPPHGGSSTCKQTRPAPPWACAHCLRGGWRPRCPRPVVRPLKPRHDWRG